MVLTYTGNYDQNKTPKLGNTHSNNINTYYGTYAPRT